MNLKLRPWQTAALDKALAWLTERRYDRHFLINAAPGSGKTLVSCAIAQALIQRGEIDRVIVIAPRSEVVNQWAGDFQRVTGRFMGKVTGSDGDIAALGTDVCATWASVQGLLDAFQAVCNQTKVLVICDEHHHAAVQAAWGTSADSAFAKAIFVLVLTGTPIRSDAGETIWLAYDDSGAIDHPDEGTYTLTYGEAVDLGYCRPVTFHRHEGEFSVDLEGGDHIQVSSQKPAQLTTELSRIPGLQRVLSFYRLACTPQYEPDGETPRIDGYQASMLEYAIQKLNRLRDRMPNAGGLIISPSIGMAKYLMKLLEKLEGDETPILVHSQMPNAEGRIKAFKNTNKRWLVSVAMISEGVDIPRLRVLVYLPNAMTELAFRQAIGRVVRTEGPNDDTRAYVVMPSLETFDMYARRVEEEMPQSVTGEADESKTKRCPTCSYECDLGAKTCNNCNGEFPQRPARFKACQACGSLNPASAQSCQACGASFAPNFVLTLDEALRAGAIIRGMDLSEEEVRESEQMAEAFRDRILRSGDGNLIRLLKAMPEESISRLKSILSPGRK